MDNHSVAVVDNSVKLTLEWSFSYEQSFTTHLLEMDRSQRTVSLYTIALRDFCAWYTAQNNVRSFDPVEVTPLDIRAYKNDLAGRMKAASVNAYLAGVRSFFTWAQAQGMTQTNPALNIKGIRQQARAPKWLSRQEQYKLLRAVEQAVQLGDLRAGGDMAQPGAIWSRRDRALVQVMLGAGLRVSEVAALRRADVVIKPRSGRVTVRRGKGSKTREVPLNGDTRKALQDWLDVRPQIEGEDGFFLSQKGGGLSARAIGGVIARLSKNAGLEGVHPHTLRHCCAKNLVDQGVGIEKVAMLLGHENLETTHIYTTPSAADLQAAVELTNWSD